MKPGDIVELEHDCDHTDGYTLRKGERGIITSELIRARSGFSHYHCVFDRHRSSPKIVLVAGYQVKLVHPLEQLAEQAK